MPATCDRNDEAEEGDPRFQEVGASAQLDGPHAARAEGMASVHCALKTQLRTVKGMLFDRRDAFTNKARTDLLLGLITLHLNENDDPRRYATLLRDYLIANNGGPGVKRGAICDPKGKPTLRS